MKNKAVLVVDDEDLVRSTLERILKKERYRVFCAPDGRAGINIVKKHSVNVVLADLKMPRLDGFAFLKASKEIDPDIEVVVMTGYGSIDSAVESIKAGAYDYIQKPLTKATILRVIRMALERQSLATENKYLRQKINEIYDFKQLYGKSKASRKVTKMIEKVADTSAAVLIRGESGTGKDVVARVIHEASGRSEHPFITVNCAALPENLLEGEIFGYEKGAFTGAESRKRGRFDLADQGTLYLDEIGEMSPYIQVKLLRFLQNGEFERLGGTETLHSDVRLITATNADLEDLITRKLFREDLYYRLNVVSIQLPPLRECTGDIPLLADHFLKKYCQQFGKPEKELSGETLKVMAGYEWPGNIRELENVIKRAVVYSSGEMVEPGDLPPELTGGDESAPLLQVPYGMTLNDVSLEVIKATLRRTHGDKVEAAKTLGISARTIYRKLEEGDKQR